MVPQCVPIFEVPRAGEILVGSLLLAIWKPNGQLRGMIAGHVVDFLFAGPPEDPQWLQIEERIREHYKWSPWESGKFVQCGTTIQEEPGGGFSLSQPHYLDKISELNLNAARRRDKNAPTTEFEKTKLRGILGGLSWHCQQAAPHFSAEVGLLLSDISASTVETVFRVNNLPQRAKARRDHKMYTHACPKVQGWEFLHGRMPLDRIGPMDRTLRVSF